MAQVTQQFNDPDFDQLKVGTGGAHKRSMLEQISPKTMLIVGIVLGAMALCTIGFFFLLGVYLKRINTANSISIPPTPIAARQPLVRAPSGARAIPPIANTDHVRGNKNAKLTWIEYSDMECPFCKRFHPTMLQMMQEYGGKIKWVYRHFPLSFHQNAQKEAEASECANELGGNDAFWKYTDAILERTTSNGTGFALNALVPLAKELGLNERKFKDCLDNGKYAQHVADDMSGGSAAGVNGTPGSFLIGKDGKAQFISGALPYESIKAVIDAELR